MHIFHFLKLLKRHVLKDQDLIKLVFTASLRDILKGNLHFFFKLEVHGSKTYNGY